MADGPKFGFVIPSFGPFSDPVVFGDLVDAAEDLGYEDVWFGDHLAVPKYASHLMSPDWVDPFASCLIGLGRTSRLRFGTDVLVAPYRNPVQVAKTAASADRLASGRLTLAFGVGYLRGEFAALGADYENRGAVTDECLEVLKLLWESTGPVSYRGKHIKFEDTVFGPRPVQDPMPLWVGGNIPRALRRAARLGNGWHPLFPTPEQYAVARQTILELREPDAGPFTFSYSAGATQVLDSDPGEYNTQTWGDIEGVPDDFDYSPPLPTASTGRPRLWGTADQVAADIQEYVSAGIEHFTLRFANGSPDVSPDDLFDQLRRFATEVAPRFP